MGSSGRGVRPLAAGAVLAGLFFVSLGASAAATVALSSNDTVPPPDAGGSTTSAPPSNSPSSTSGATSSKSAGKDTIKPLVLKVSSAPKKATKDQIKQSTSGLCKAQPGKLPTLDFDADSSQWIKTLEILASSAGYAPGPIDGIYTVQTRNAIRGFQDLYGLTSSGVMGSSTWQALWNDLCAPDPVVVPQPTYTPPSDSGGGGGGGLNRLD